MSSKVLWATGTSPSVTTNTNRYHSDVSSSSHMPKAVLGVATLLEKPRALGVCEE